MTTVTASVDERVLQGIDALELSAESKRLRAAYFDTSTRISTERPRIAMRAWQESEGLPVATRRAHLFERVLAEVPVAIHPDELTVGSETRWFRGVYPTVDHDPELLLRQLAKGALNLQSIVHHGQITKEDWDGVVETARYFSGKTGPDLIREVQKKALGTWWDDFIEVSGTTPFESGFIVAGVPLYEKVLARGLSGIVGEAEEKLARFADLREDDPEKLLFWQGSIAACKAAIAFAERYADVAEQMAAREQDKQRKGQLQRVAQACRWVPANPARSFFEAVQSVRLVHLACKLEGTFSASMGRIDQYLYPFFSKDLAAGRLTLQDALDLLADLFSYLARQDLIFDIKNAQNAQSSSAIVNITVGGVTRDGRDASNELTYLALHAAGLVKYAQPQLTFRLNPATSRRMLHKALQTNLQVGGGIPQFHNDTHVIDYLVERGASIEDARDWAAHGCSQPVSPKHRTYIKPAAWPNVPLALDLALHNGIASKSGKRIGLETGDPRGFATFDEFYAAFKRQLEFILRRCAWQCRFAMRAWAQRQRLPFLSSVLPGCLERGLDVIQGGQPDHSLWYIKDRGIVNAADSLTAVKTLVFDEKRLSMEDLLAALDNNFAGERGEKIRRLCLEAPKYGNEDSTADAMVRDLAKFSASVIFSEPNAFGQPYAINRNGVAWHYYGGRGVGALPDGRKAEEALADGSLSPMRGLDRHGPTAVLKSALSADFRESAISILNLRFPRTLAQSPEALGKLAALTEAFVHNGGTHIQYNLLDHRVLLEAKKNPEKFKDLVVRVAGYSAYFIHLTPEVQDDIIRRTEHGF